MVDRECWRLGCSTGGLLLCVLRSLGLRWRLLGRRELLLLLLHGVGRCALSCAGRSLGSSNLAHAGIHLLLLVVVLWLLLLLLRRLPLLLLLLRLLRLLRMLRLLLRHLLLCYLLWLLLLLLRMLRMLLLLLSCCLLGSLLRLQSLHHLQLLRAHALLVHWKPLHVAGHHVIVRREILRHATTGHHLAIAGSRKLLGIARHCVSYAC